MSTEMSLKQVPMFSQLSDEALADVAASLKPRQIAAGEVLFNQGDPGDELMIVEAGRIAIFVPVAGATGGGQSIRVFQPGELLGEMALIDRKPRSASARAEEASRVLVLSGTDFRRLLRQSPEMAFSVMSGLSDKIRYTTDFLAEVRQWVRRIAEGNYQAGNFDDTSSKYQDKTLATLAAEFTQMATRVQQREETLRQQVVQLRIEIDQAKRKQEAEEIMGSEYYQSLKEKIKRLREQE